MRNINVTGYHTVYLLNMLFCVVWLLVIDFAVTVTYCMSHCSYCCYTTDRCFFLSLFDFVPLILGVSTSDHLSCKIWNSFHAGSPSCFVVKKLTVYLSVITDWSAWLHRFNFRYNGAWDWNWLTVYCMMNRFLSVYKSWSFVNFKYLFKNRSTKISNIN